MASAKPLYNKVLNLVLVLLVMLNDRVAKLVHNSETSLNNWLFVVRSIIKNYILSSDLKQ